MLLAALTTAVLITAIYVTNRTVGNQIQDDVIADFRQTQGFFEIQQRLRYDRLIESAYLIAENSTFKANLSLNDPSSMLQSINEFAMFVKSDLLIVTNTAGEVLARAGRPDQAMRDMSDLFTISEALEGVEPPVEVIFPYLWEEEGNLYQIVSIPVYVGNSIIGSLTVGTLFTESEAEELRQNTNIHVTFFLNSNVTASSKKGIKPAYYNRLIADQTDRIEHIYTRNEPTEPFRIDINNEEHFAFLSPLGIGQDAFYMASVPVQTQLSGLLNLQKNILWIPFYMFLIIIPVSIFLGRFLSGPVNRLSDAMQKVQKGDLNVFVESTSKDEIGVLARSFNQMVEGLKERYALKRYVGQHTMAMISENKEGAGERKGEVKDLAIIFTDIRNSTDLIESTEPELFIQNLNELLQMQADIAANHDGSIDKFVGDAMIAIFAGDDAINRAIECAISIQQGASKLKKNKNIFEGLGIAINYGPMVLGNIGGGERLDYTVIGREVNLCARLNNLAKNGEILIKKELIHRFNLQQSLNYLTTGEHHFKGFDQPFEIAEIVYEEK